MSATKLVMVVDDDEALRESVCEVLEDDGYMAVCMDGGSSALERLRTDEPKPSLILLDLMMPGMTGWDFRKEQLHDRALAPIPVVVMTASRELKGISANEVVFKPITREKLLAVVHRHAQPDATPEHAQKPRASAGGGTWLYSMFMQAPVPICILRGPELVFEMANPLYEEVAGRKNVVGKTLLEAIPEANGQGFVDLLRHVLATKEPHVGKEVVVRLDRDHDGVPEEAFFNFVYAPIQNPEGVVDRVMAVVNEVTDQVLARRLVEESEQKFRRIVTQVQAGIAQTDLSGRFTLTNERYSELVGRTAGELSQLRLQDLIHPDERLDAVDRLQQLVEQGAPFVAERRFVKPDGSIVWVQNSVARIDDREGHPQGIAAVTLDITQRKDAERALQESEARYRELVSQVKDYAIFRISTEGRPVTWNEGVKRVLGYDETEFIGRDVLDIFTPEDVAAGVPELELKTAAENGSASNDRWMRRKNGERFAAAGVTSGLRGADGKLLGFTKVMRDQTAKVKAEEAAGHLAAIVTSSDDAIISTDLQGTVRTWNKGAEQLYGYLPDEVIGKSVELLIPADRPNEEPGILKRIARGETVAHYETVRRRKDGSLLDVSLTVSPVQDAGGRVIGAAKIARDITFRKRLDEAVRVEREARVAEMERAVRFSEMFIGILGHDLRNPLSAITMAGSLLSRSADTPKAAKPASRIVSSAARMERMISQLLDFTRFRLGRGIPLERAPVDLAEVCRTVIGEVETATSCAVELEQAGDTNGNWDRDRLAQLVSNLVANACHHGTQGCPVGVRLNGSAADRVQIEVRNQGAIPTELLPVLFEPLRYDEDTKKSRQQSSGLGLGLYITQQIVLAHGGQIRVESNASQGTRFAIELPRHPPATADRVFGSVK